MGDTASTSDLIPASAMRDEVPGTTDQFWNQLRHKGGGPVYLKLGRRVFYRRSDIEAWLEANRYARTDKPLSTARRSR